MVPRDTPWGELDWKYMGDPGVMTLVDPLPLIDRYCLVEELWSDGQGPGNVV
jgi:hypothetical protein